MGIERTEIELQESVLSCLGRPVDCRAVFKDLAEAYATDPFYLWTGCLSYMTAEKGFYVYDAQAALWRPFVGASNIDSIRYTDLYDATTGLQIERYGGLLQMLDFDGNIVMEAEVPLSLRDVQEVMSADGTAVISYKGVLQYKGKDVTIASSMLTFVDKTLFPPVGEVTNLYLDTTTDTVYIWDVEAQEYKALNSAKVGIELTTRVAIQDGQGRFEIGTNFNPNTDVISLSKNGLDFPKEDYTVINDNGVYYVELLNGEEANVGVGDEFVITAYRSMDLGSVNAANVIFNNTAQDGTLIFDGRPDDVQEALEQVGIALKGLKGSAQYIGYFENDEAVENWLQAGNIPPANGWITVASSDLIGHEGKKVKMIWDEINNTFVYAGEIDEAMIVLDDNSLNTNVVWSSAKVNNTFRRLDKPVPWSQVWDEVTVELNPDGTPMLDADGNPVPSPKGMLSERHKLHKLDDTDITELEMNVTANPQNIGKVVTLGKDGKFILGAGAGGVYIDEEGSTIEVGGVQEGYKTTAMGVNIADLLYLMLHPIKPPIAIVELNFPTNSKIYEMGYKIVNPKVTVTFKQTSYPLASARLEGLYGNVVKTWGEALLRNKVNSFTIDSGTDVSGPYQWNAFVSDNQGLVGTGFARYRFGYKVFWGTLTQAEINAATCMEDLEPLLQKEILEIRTSFEKQYTGTVKHIVFAYPTNWGNFASVRDVKNGFDIENNSFLSNKFNYTLPDGSVIEYTLYQQDIVCTVDKFLMKVSF